MRLFGKGPLPTAESAGILGCMLKFLLPLALIASPAIAQDNTGESTGDGEELAFIMDLFAELQPRSVTENRELCGYIGYNRLGELRATRIMEGDEASCLLPNWPIKLTVIASFHTHSTFSRDYDSEVPSVIDIETDESSGIDGYVATPGGRLWYVDTDTMTVSQICGIGCLPQDPAFLAAADGAVRASYTYRGLQKRAAMR